MAYEASEPDLNWSSQIQLSTWLQYPVGVLDESSLVRQMFSHPCSDNGVDTVGFTGYRGNRALEWFDPFTIGYGTYFRPIGVECIDPIKRSSEIFGFKRTGTATDTDCCSTRITDECGEIG